MSMGSVLYSSQSVALRNDMNDASSSAEKQHVQGKICSTPKASLQLQGISVQSEILDSCPSLNPNLQLKFIYLKTAELQGCFSAASAASITAISVSACNRANINKQHDGMHILL